MVLIIILTVIPGCILLAAGAVFTMRAVRRRRLKARHRIASPGIDSEEMVQIGGIRQYIYIRGQNLDNPILLFLHGGPGSPMTPFLHGYQYEWEQSFTVVNWDQRGAGKTYFANDAGAVYQTLGFERMTQDAAELAEYLLKRFQRQKIILMGHSWGSELGMALVQRHPDFFSAYIAVGQVVNIRENERVGYETVLEAARKAGSSRDVRALEAMAPYPADNIDDTIGSLMKLRRYQHHYGFAESIDLGNILLVGTSPYYSFREALFFFKDATKIQRPLYEYVFQDFDARAYGTAYSVPVYYLMGETDYQTPITLAKEWFDQIEAPDKAFFTIKGAGHAAMIDKPGEFAQILTQAIRPRVVQP